MGFDIGVIERDYTGNEDRSWIGHRDGMDSARSITLDPSLFTYPAHFVKGAIPSGIALGKVTATGLYGPYDGGGGHVNEIIQLVVDATGGTYTLTYSGHTTAAIPYNAPAAAVQAALIAIGGGGVINPGDIIVGGGPGGLETGPGQELGAPSTHPYNIWFEGALADAEEVLTADSTNLTGLSHTASLADVQGGVDVAATDGRQVFAGFLLSTTKVGYAIPGGSDYATAAKVGAALYWEGIVKLHRLPVFAGTLAGVVDAAAIAAARFIRFEA